MRRRGFTLLELVAAIAIITLAVGLAVSTLRTESPIQQLNNAALQFEEFCMRVRFQALENGADRIVAFHPGEKRFFLRIPQEFMPESTDPASEKIEPETDKTVVQEWKLPEHFELGEGLFDESELDDNGTVELFRFFPDGGASGKRRFELHFRSLKRIFEISPLTGRMMIHDSTEDGIQ